MKVVWKPLLLVNIFLNLSDYLFDFQGSYLYDQNQMREWGLQTITVWYIAVCIFFCKCHKEDEDH